MKLDFKRLNTLLEAKASRAIDRLDGLKCYTDEFQDTLDAIVYMLEVSKELEQYDTECPDCKHRNEQLQQPQHPQQPEYIGKPYKPFGKGKRADHRIVMFYSNNCQPCQYLKPILEMFVVQNKLELELVLVDEKAGQQHAQEHQVQGWPTVFVIKNDVIEHVMIGADINAPTDTTKGRLTEELLPFFR
jgi:thiol-disulfide isomerase/thioredoxin